MTNINEQIANKYQKKSQLEHILDIPDTYIGSIEKQDELIYIFNDTTNKINKKKITYISGLQRIFEEIILNAFDQTVRLGTNTTQIKVKIDKEKNEITVWNDGKGIPVIYKESEKVYIPEMIFGMLLTSGNYDKKEKRITGGKNGYGAKLTNIFSNEFKLETVDEERKKKFQMTWKNNMGKKSKETITETDKSGYTKITFKPDLKRFNINELSDDMISLMKKRVYDLAANTNKNVSVSYNGKKIGIKKFEDYIKLYLKEGETKKILVDEDTNERWSVGLYMTEDNFEQVSFVNGINTNLGGTHVDYIVNKIIKEYMEKFAKKKVDVKKSYIKDKMCIFVKSFIENPTFNSQTKETMNTRSSKFGSVYNLTKKFTNGLNKMGIIEEVLSFARFKEEKNLEKTDGKIKRRITGIPKLEDANWAGTKKSVDCKLILTEGDSAKTFAMSGISKIGRDQYGIFPLKGKLLNVKDQSTDKILNNIEINNLKKILGLKQNHKYTSLDELRYGGIIILTDQDSVTGDTPLLLKNGNTIEIKNIEDLTTEFNYQENNISGKEYGKTDYQVWTETGWTNIKHIMRHKTTKKIYRVLTHTGCVDVTEDHSLLNKNAEKIKPTECKIGNELLHSFPLLEENKVIIPDNFEKLSVRDLWKYASEIGIQYYESKKKVELLKLLNEYKNRSTIKLTNDVEIDVDEAWVMGFFLADGSCGIYEWKYQNKPKNRPKEYIFNKTSYSWHLDNTDISLLEKSKEILEKIYGDIFNLVETKSHENNKKMFRLILNGGMKTKHIIEKYRKLMYYKKDKFIHPILLNNTKQVREQIYEGYYQGDGLHYSDRTNQFDVNSKITSQCLYFLCKSLGYNVSINHQIKKQKIYSFLAHKGKSQKNPIAIKKIIQLPTTEQYVYDLETENHHFQAGVGKMIVSNTDGSHIKGLVMNLFHTFWPELLELGFVKSLITPIVKAFEKKGTKSVILFYNLTDFENWKQTIDLTKWTTKYYKGLGTSNAKEAKESLENIEKKIVTYTWDDSSNKSLDLGFKKDRSDMRKKWLLAFNKNEVLDQKIKRVTITDFINKELIFFSNYDIHRSIPSLVDGLKPTQRKILYTGLNYLKNKEIKVAQFSGLVGQKTDYHHGEASIVSTVIKMAQNYVGSNNCNLYLPNGQFGTRLLGGDDRSSERYIFTDVSGITKKIFNLDDNPLLNYLDSDGLSIEPEWYIPSIPLILLNGTNGIGTGFSTTVLQHKLEDLVENIKNMLDNKTPKTLVPWYRSFKGKIEEISTNKYQSVGIYELDNENNKIIIKELPIGSWTEKYKEYLERLLIDKSVSVKNELKIQCIKNYNNYSTESNVNFELEFSGIEYKKMTSKGEDHILKTLKLTSNLSETNMYLFDKNNNIRKYKNTGEIMKSYYDVRLEYYELRKKKMIEMLENIVEELSNKVRFIRMVKSKSIDILDTTDEKLDNDLEKNGFVKLLNSSDELTYNYLTTMHIRSLTLERADKLESECNLRMKELEKLKLKKIKNMWLEDLEKILIENEKYNNILSNDISLEKNERKSKKKNSKK